MAKSLEDDAERANHAFEVHAALLRAETETPDLKSNPLWTIHRQDAYERFFLAMNREDQ